MTTTQETPMVNYWTIFNELMKTQEPLRKARELARVCLPSTGVTLREFSTIGFTTARQTGKTRFVSELLERNPESLVVVSNLTWKEQLFIARDLATGELCLPEHLQPQVITTKQLIDCQTAVMRRLKVAPFVILDESHAIYQRLRRQAFMNLVAEHNTVDAIVVEIN